MIKIKGYHLDTFITYLVDNYTREEWIKKNSALENFAEYEASFYEKLKNCEFMIIKGEDDLCNVCPVKEKECFDYGKAREADYLIVEKLGLEFDKSYSVEELQKRFFEYHFEEYH